MSRERPAERVLEVIRRRRSVRRYTDEPVPEADVDSLVEAFLTAPSASNTQPWFIVACSRASLIADCARAVRDEVESIVRAAPEFGETGERLIRYATFFEGAPLVFFVAAEPGSSGWRQRLAGLLPGHPAAGESHSWLVSTAAAIENLLLTAEALGYGACWLGAPLVARERLERILELTPGRELVAIIPVGCPAEEPEPPARRPLEQTCRRLT